MITWVQDEPRPDTPEDREYRNAEVARKAEVAECADVRGHVWWLELEHPEDGAGVALSCEHCPAGIDDLYPDGVDLISGDFDGVSVDAGCHNSSVPLLIPVDAEVHGNYSHNPISGEEWDVEFTVAPRGPARPMTWPPNHGNDNGSAITEAPRGYARDYRPSWIPVEELDTAVARYAKEAGRG